MARKPIDATDDADDVLESSTAELLTGPIDAAWARAVLAFQERLITSILRPHLLVAAPEPEPEPVADPTVPPELVPLLRASGELGMARYRYVTWSISRQCWSIKLPRTVDPRPRMRGEYATQEEAARAAASRAVLAELGGVVREKTWHVWRTHAWRPMHAAETGKARKKAMKLSWVVP
jgi:hypothetical protein